MCETLMIKFGYSRQKRLTWRTRLLKTKDSSRMKGSLIYQHMKQIVVCLERPNIPYFIIEYCVLANLSNEKKCCKCMLKNVCDF